MEEYGAEVIAFYGDFGQAGDLEAVRDRAVRLGASKVCIRDLRAEFAERYAFQCLRAGALYQGRYPMSSSLTRPILAKELAAIADEEGADSVAHGCSGKGNDQVRFAASIAAIAPQVRLLTPLIDWPLHSRDEEIEYARARGIDVPISAEAPYSLDENLWGRSIGCGPLEDLTTPLDEEVFELTRSPGAAPDRAHRVAIGFERGVPRSLDGERHDAVTLVQTLNRLGGEHGIGRIEHMEDKVVGIKSREVYECPGATILYRAHADLEELTLDKATLDFKRVVSLRYAEIVYSGMWFSPLKQSLDAFVDDTQQFVTGTVTMELYKGACTVVGRSAPQALYDYALSTYDRGDAFDHTAGAGFTELTSLPLRIVATARRRAAVEAGAR
jgi:argininosuccinate synthase